MAGRAASDAAAAHERPLPAGRASVGDHVLVAALCILGCVTLYRVPDAARDARTVANAPSSETFLAPLDR